MNRIPVFNFGKKICIICEGFEEYDYLKRMNELKVWNSIYQIDLVNAQGNGNVFARYQDKYQNGMYDLVLIFCDTDRKPYEQYIDIKRKVNDFHGTKNAADCVIIFGNPCTMQIILLHFCDVLLTSQNKKKTSPIIQKIFGITYNAHKEERAFIMKNIDPENYQLMKDRLMKLSSIDTDINSSNFSQFIHYFESKETSWIDEINKKL